MQRLARSLSTRRSGLGDDGELVDDTHSYDAAGNDTTIAHDRDRYAATADGLGGEAERKCVAYDAGNT